MADNYIIDIIIPTFNEENYIFDCLSSVIEFEIPDDTKANIFIIDGGSKDNTIEIVKSLVNTRDNIFILNNPKRIQSAALNIAIKNFTGDYLMRLDAHCIYNKSYLKLCI